MFKYIAIGFVAFVMVVGGILALWGIGAYNGLASGAQATEAAWSQVQNVYQRRYDLIPNLVETVKGEANFEKSTLVGIADARASVGRISVDMKNAPATMAEIKAFQAAQTGLSASVSRLLSVAENYPQLKANEGFRDLRAQLEGSENRISVERRTFNTVVQDYNGRVVRFPGNLLAGMFGFKVKPYFEMEAAAKTAPKISFETVAPVINVEKK